MKKSRLSFILAISLGALALSGCASSEEEMGATPAVEELPMMTMDEVSENDGLDGRDAYVVVDGIVYDVTESSAWPDGVHNENQAGQDLTQELEDGPHGAENLENVTAIGRIKE